MSEMCFVIVIIVCDLLKLAGSCDSPAGERE